MEINNIQQLLLSNKKASNKIIENVLNDLKIPLSIKWDFFSFIVENDIYRNEYWSSELELESFPSKRYPLYYSFYIEKSQSRSMISILNDIIYIKNKDELKINIDDIKKEIIEKRYTHYINDL